ncbi:hypothetical protein GUITHDRAFT_116436 [Guillardia theta CCMP2712]|uniref:PDZ domain-containing protein n=1 Tax=Guillardia theta (strain CCMP2712) TaxID=905079 RepID=L1INF0_GUITC|nr:hypothetical protein GUITHDRAFT_116436 [Guillardia theta CCMP2712]EKX37325.1 hypothetical protein GUITHDRAFT_116436 [Guillardia theta CCMP2712]|eukprot:XP_005824305.1 hypothetical protein GUITHDRAFT_116436 [Guillardia theta CCMP2712]
MLGWLSDAAATMVCCSLEEKEGLERPSLVHIRPFDSHQADEPYKPPTMTLGSVGITISTISPDRPLNVTSVEAGGPADRAGMQVQDKLLQIDGIACTSPNDAVRLFALNSSAANPVAVHVLRDKVDGSGSLKHDVLELKIHRMAAVSAANSPGSSKYTEFHRSQADVEELNDENQRQDKATDEIEKGLAGYQHVDHDPTQAKVHESDWC